MNKLKTTLIALLITLNVMGEENKFNLSFHGFVAVDAAHNSREAVIARNNHIHLYPLPAKWEEGKDINAQANYDIDAAHTRIGAHLKHINSDKMTTVALIEFDFLGASSISTDSYPRLRHAYVKFIFDKYDITAGQTWHPLFMPNHYPRTVNSNAGAPIHPLCRNPQIRFSHRINDNIHWNIAVIEQNNFRSVGFGDGSENSLLPEVDAQLAFSKNSIETVFTAGYKKLSLPRHGDESLPFWEKRPTVDSWHFQFNLLADLNKYSIRSGTLYGGNLTEHVMPGGVGQVTSSNPVSPKFEDIKTISVWTDVEGNQKKWAPGFFVGYVENLGANKEIIVNNSHCRNSDLANLLVIAPRIKYHLTQQTFVGLEYSYNSAGWGSDYNSKGKPTNSSDFVNHRTLLSVRYTF